MANDWRKLRWAPAPGTRLASVNEIPDGACREFVFGEGKDAFRLLILRDGDELWSYLNRCPHYGIPLNVRPDTFVCPAKRQIMCVVHCSYFRFEDGHCVDGPAKGFDLDAVPIEVRDEEIFVA